MGVAGGRPRGGGALRRCEGRLSTGALPPPAARPQGGLSGSATQVLWARLCGRGCPTLPLWLACAAGGCVLRGWWEAVGGGAWPSTVVWGVWCQALSLPWPPIPWGGQQFFRDPCFPGTIGWALGSGTGPTACALASRHCALWGWREGVPRGGGGLRRCEGRLSSGALPPPAARPQGGLSGSATQVLWARLCGPGCPALPLWLACTAGGCVPRGWWEAVSVGVAFHWCWGRLVSGAVPSPAARPLGRAARVARPVFSGRGWCGLGDPAPAPQCALLRADVARCGGGGGASPGGGVPCAVVRDV